jgi:DNA polymerase-4
VSPSSTTPPRILLADADAFYVAVARLVDPAGAGKAPLLIVGGSSKQRGVVTSASYEARKFGVTSAMPMARALRLCPKATVVPVPFEACVEKSRAIRVALQDFTPIVEAASSDEFYLDLTGTEKLYKGESLTATAHKIREAVLRKTQLHVSIGGGTNRLVAKMAATLAKPAGVFIVEPGEEAAFMRRFTLADIPMVGPKAQQRLARLGLKTVDDALRHERPPLIALLGEREGNWLYDRVRGRAAAHVESRGEAKSISRDQTFSKDLSDLDGMTVRLLRLVDRAARDLRDDGFLARTVGVRVRDHDFTDRQASRTLAQPISTERAIARVAKELLARLHKARPVPCRLLGVQLSNLVGDEGPAQLDLLAAKAAGPDETERDRKVSQAIDAVRRKLGSDVVQRGQGTRGRGAGNKGQGTGRSEKREGRNDDR